MAIKASEPVSVFLLINALEGGGAEKQLLITAAGLQRLGIRCFVYWLEDRSVHPQCEKLIELAKREQVIFSAPRNGASLDYRQLLRLRSQLRNDKKALLWTWGYRADLVSLFILLTAKHTNIIGSLRSAAEHKINKFAWFWRVLSKTHCAFVSNSQLNVALVTRVAPGIRDKARVIYNAVESSYFQIPRCSTARPTRLQVVMLGNQATYIKGYDIAVEVAKLIHSHSLPITIYIGGAPSDRPTLEMMIHANNVEEEIKLMGSITDVSQFLGRADIFMMLSRYEGTPNALLEAMSLGLPIISTRVGDLAAIAVDGTHLRLIDTSAKAAFDALRDLWDNWPQAQQMASAGREFCRDHFEEKRMIESTSKYISELVARNNA